MTFKEKIYEGLQQALTDKINLLQQELESLFISAQNETKRTAGDKHETALAMLQLDQERLRHQLSEAKNQQSALQKINPLIICDKVCPGALVKTNLGYFFIALALGKITQDNFDVISLSPQSPLASRMMGLNEGQELILNTRKYLIEEIY